MREVAREEKIGVVKRVRLKEGVKEKGRVRVRKCGGRSERGERRVWKGKRRVRERK